MGMVQSGLVSTIVPVFNRAGALRVAVQSVLDQTYRSIEVVIVDDGSTDDTGTVADALAAQHPEIVSVVHQINRGVGYAREAGRQAVKGEFIQYLDSDDFLLPRKFELQVAGLRKEPSCDISYGRTRAYHVATREHYDEASRRTGEKLDTLFPAILAGRPWHTVTPLYRRSALDRIGPWSGLQQFEDWEYDCRLGALGCRLYHCDEFIAEQRHHDEARLCRAWQTRDRSLQDLAEAMLRIEGHAKAAGVGPTCPEMQRFARDMLYWARVCAGRGLGEEAQRLFSAGMKVSNHRRLVWGIYGIFGRGLGWQRAEGIAGTLWGKV